MNLLLDQGLPRSAIKFLTEAGFVSQHVGDIGMESATDGQILAAAHDRNAVLITLDADFHRLLSISQATSPSVVRIRIEGLKGQQLADVVLTVLANANAELQDGAVVSVTSDRIRIHALPIGN